jgi:hypothetical protein
MLEANSTKLFDAVGRLKSDYELKATKKRLGSNAQNIAEMINEFVQIYGAPFDIKTDKLSITFVYKDGNMIFTGANPSEVIALINKM